MLEKYPPEQLTEQCTPMDDDTSDPQPAAETTAGDEAEHGPRRTTNDIRACSAALLKVSILYRPRHGNMRGTCMCWGFDCGCRRISVSLAARSI